MDPLLYCLPRNLIGYDQFIDYLAKQDLILIGEDHPTDVHGENEERILRDLSGNEKVYSFVLEKYSPRIELFERLGLPVSVWVNSDSRVMAQILGEIVSSGQPVISVLGNNHLATTNGFIGAWFRESDITTTCTYQEGYPRREQGIYQAVMAKEVNFLINGSLL